MPPLNSVRFVGLCTAFKLYEMLNHFILFRVIFSAVDIHVEKYSDFKSFSLMQKHFMQK